MNENQKEILRAAIECEGVELHRSDWKDAEDLVKKGKGTLGSARGPGKNFRRFTPLTGRRKEDE
ncbi:MAG: hypothetical protein AB7V18_19325 [Pyrinomonadaceae bacterium]